MTKTAISGSLQDRLPTQGDNLSKPVVLCISPNQLIVRALYFQLSETTEFKAAFTLADGLDLIKNHGSSAAFIIVDGFVSRPEHPEPILLFPLIQEARRLTPAKVFGLSVFDSVRERMSREGMCHQAFDLEAICDEIVPVK